MNVRWMNGTLTLVAAVALAGCGNAQAGAEGGEAAVRIINVEVTEIASSPFVDEVGLTGTAMANRDVQVAA